MKRVLERLQTILLLTERAAALPPLLARLGVGLMFFGGAIRKATHLADFVAYFESLHIPMARLQAPFVITSYDGIDPEIGNGIDNNIYPRPRTYLVGFSINF